MILEPDDVGAPGVHSPGYNSFSTLPSSLYISRDVLKYRSGPPAVPAGK